jgi:hypothetical protein
MLLNKEKVGWVLKLFAREFVTAAEKREHAKRKQTALSSLPAPTRWESDRATGCDKSRSLAVAGTDRPRFILWMPFATNGGEDTGDWLRLVGSSGEDCCLRAGGVRRVIPALAFSARRTAIYVAAHT